MWGGGERARPRGLGLVAGHPKWGQGPPGSGEGFDDCLEGMSRALQRRVVCPERGPGKDRVDTGLPTPGPSLEGELRGAARPIWFFTPDC